VGQQGAGLGRAIGSISDRASAGSSLRSACMNATTSIAAGSAASAFRQAAP
jgi:hypothetical protein